MKLQTDIGLLRLKNGYSHFMKLFFFLISDGAIE